MEYSATTKYVRTAPRKLRLVADSIRKLRPAQALIILEKMTKLAARPLLLTLKSAINNAEQKKAKLDGLSFKLIEVMGGPALKRWQAVSRGSAHSYKKRMTHIKIILTDVGGNHGTKS